MSKPRYYTGIGARVTPDEILEKITNTACYLSLLGYRLRSGNADGADLAFQIGAKGLGEDKYDIYVPWEGFNKERGTAINNIVPSKMSEAMEIASTIHPNWSKCTETSKKFHARNVCQVLGDDLDTPSSFVLYWAEERGGIVQGGTATAVNLARKLGIPAISVGSEGWEMKLMSQLRDNGDVS